MSRTGSEKPVDSPDEVPKARSGEESYSKLGSLYAEYNSVSSVQAVPSSERSTVIERPSVVEPEKRSANNLDFTPRLEIASSKDGHLKFNQPSMTSKYEAQSGDRSLPQLKINEGAKEELNFGAKEVSRVAEKGKATAPDDNDPMRELEAQLGLRSGFLAIQEKAGGAKAGTGEKPGPSEKAGPELKPEAESQKKASEGKPETQKDGSTLQPDGRVPAELNPPVVKVTPDDSRTDFLPKNDGTKDERKGQDQVLPAPRQEPGARQESAASDLPKTDPSKQEEKIMPAPAQEKSKEPAQNEPWLPKADSKPEQSKPNPQADSKQESKYLDPFKPAPQEQAKPNGGYNPFPESTEKKVSPSQSDKKDVFIPSLPKGEQTQPYNRDGRRPLLPSFGPSDGSTPVRPGVDPGVQRVPNVPDAQLTMTGPPTITPQKIDQVLASYGSPAQGMGQKVYDMGVAHGINPALALAFYIQESSAGTRGKAVRTNSWGNEKGWRYNNIEDGLKRWYTNISQNYVGKGFNRLPNVIHKYAPYSDGNDEAAYLRTVAGLIRKWQQ